MKIVLFYHSLISDWNHGNAHFLRGIYAALEKMGHQVQVYEPGNGWSLQSLIEHQSQTAVDDFHRNFPHLRTHFYNPDAPDLNRVLQDADLVLVHEWNDPALVAQIGQKRLSMDFTLLFHDTHHRAVSAKAEMQKYNLEHYDGVLAFGDTLSKVYKQEGWHGRVYTWHEAADTDTYYHPVEGVEQEGDVVWIGNWGDDERTQELHEYILEPVKALGLRVKFYGVRYPGHAMKALAAAGIIYGDWLPSYKVAETFARYKATIHVPRRFYNEYLPGIPTIRPFEAMACKIPLLCAPWQDVEQLFEEGKDYLMARSGQEMTDLLHQVISKPQLSRAMCEHAYHTILDRHTCRHRAEQLMGIMKDIIQSKAIKTSV